MTSTMRIVENRGATAEERDYYALSSKVYGAFAPYYDLVVRPIRRMRRQVANLSEIRLDSKVLDVATGTGAQAFAFADIAGEVVGVDISKSMLEIAKRKNRYANVTFRTADATDLPFEEGTFDVACISFALHEMPGSIRRRVIREMARVTKKDGTVLVVDYGLPRNALARWFVYRLVKLYERPHYAQFVRSDLETFLRSEGVEVGKRHRLLAGLIQVIGGRPVQATHSVAAGANGSEAPKPART